DGIELAALAVGKGERFALWDALRNKPAVLPAVDHGREHARRPSLLVDVLGVKQLLDQPDLIVGVEYCEGGLQVDKLGVPAQDRTRGGMEGAGPWDAPGHGGDSLRGRGLSPPGRPGWGGSGGEFGRAGGGQVQNMGNARGEHACLAGPG